MHKKRHKWLYGILASMITLALLFGAQAMFNKYAMARPMDKMFEQMKEIESFQVIFGENGRENEIRIKLNDVKNLQTLYRQIIKNLDKYGGAQKYNIILTDSRDEYLEDFYYQIHYFLEEAKDNSNFALMNEKIQTKAVASGILVQIYVDSAYIYLQMKKEKAENLEPPLEKTDANSQMYIVLPRKHSSAL